MARVMSRTEEPLAVVAAAADPTAELTAGLARGDERAWIAFHTGYKVRLKSYLRTCLRGGRGDVDDLFQETMLRVARHARRFESDEVFWSWLTVLARSALADHGRRRSAWAGFLERYRRWRDGAPGDVPERHLEAALALLPPDDRALIEDKYEHGLSVRALAQRAGVTERVIEHRLAKARRQLAKRLRQQRESEFET